MDKQTVVHPDNAMLLSAKNHELSIHEKTYRKLKCKSLSERSQATHCMISTTGHSKKGKTMNTVKQSVFGGVSKEQIAEWRIFRAVKILCVIL